MVYFRTTYCGLLPLPDVLSGLISLMWDLIITMQILILDVLSVVHENTVHDKTVVHVPAKR